MISGEELEAILTQFLAATREAEATWLYCSDVENENNNQTQDVLHAIEIAPEILSNIDVVQLLHKIRQERRVAKQEVAVADIFNQWVINNKKVVKSLETVLGNVRKEIKQQPTAAYNWRTNLICEKGSWLEHDAGPNLIQPVFPEWATFISTAPK